MTNLLGLCPLTTTIHWPCYYTVHVYIVIHFCDIKSVGFFFHGSVFWSNGGFVRSQVDIFAMYFLILMILSVKSDFIHHWSPWFSCKIADSGIIDHLPNYDLFSKILCFYKFYRSYFPLMHAIKSPFHANFNENIVYYFKNLKTILML